MLLAAGLSARDVRDASPRMFDLVVELLLKETSPLPVANGKPIQAALPYPRIETADEFAEWIKDKSGSLSVIYFVGDLARFRHEAPKRIAHLERLQDEAPRHKMRPATEGMEIEDIRKTLDLCRWVQQYGTEFASLSQSRTPEPGKFLYIATRRPR